MAKPLWRQCIEWLERIGLLPIGHRLLDPLVTPEQLCASLRDGVLLCLSLNRLKPDTLDINREVSLWPHDSEFLCVANILLFRNRCKAVFHLRTADIFDCHRLYHMEKFDQTLNTLSLLSKCPVAQQFCSFRGFPDVSDPSVWRSEQPIYDNLESSALPSTNYYDLYSHLLVDDVDGGYGDVDSFDSHKSQVDPTTKLRLEVANVINELIEREEFYTETLRNIQTYFMTSLKPLLPPKTYQTIFIFYESQLQCERYSIYSILYELHDQFLQKLKSVKGDTARGQSTGRMVDGIGNCFKCFNDFYFPYSYYFAHYDEAVDSLEISLEVSEQFQDSVEAAERQFNSNTSTNHQVRFGRLREQLRKPFDHVTRYTELLKRLKKLTEEIYDDENNSKVVGIAYNWVSKFLHFANEHKGEMCAIKSIRQIERGIANLKVSLFELGQKTLDGRLKVSEADLTRLGLIEPSKGIKFRNDYQFMQAFLFEHSLILCEPTSDPTKFTFVTSLTLEGWRCQSPFDSGTNRNANYTHQYFLENQQGQKLRFQLKKLPDKTIWVEKINSALRITELKVCQHHQFVSVSLLLTKPTVLSKCEVQSCGEFITNYGYSCRFCDFQLHYDCLAKWTEIPNCSIGADISSGQSAPIIPADRKIFWWGGVMGGSEASQRLKTRPVGTFMLRYHSSNGFRVSSVNANRGEVLHLVIQEERQQFCFVVDGTLMKFPTLPLMVSYMVKKSCEGNVTGCHRIPINHKGFGCVTHNYSIRSDTYLGVRKGEKLVILATFTNPDVVYCLCLANGNFGYLPAHVIQRY